MKLKRQTKLSEELHRSRIVLPTFIFYHMTFQAGNISVVPVVGHSYSLLCSLKTVPSEGDFRSQYASFMFLISSYHCQRFKIHRSRPIQFTSQTLEPFPSFPFLSVFSFNLHVLRPWEHISFAPLILQCLVHHHSYTNCLFRHFQISTASLLLGAPFLQLKCIRFQFCKAYEPPDVFQKHFPGFKSIPQRYLPL